MSSSYIHRLSYKVLRAQKPSLNLIQLEAEKEKLRTHLKERLVQSNLSDGSSYSFDAFSLKQFKPCHKIETKSRLFKTDLKGQFSLNGYSKVSSLGTNQDITTHVAWSPKSKDQHQTNLSHILLSKEKIKEGSQLNKFQDRYQKSK